MVEAVSMEAGNRRVYVGNLAWRVKWQDLKDHMKQAGEVRFVEIIESDGRSKGCGIVEYADTEAAEKAIQMLNDSVLCDRKMFVREDRDIKPHRSTPHRNSAAEVKLPFVNESTAGRQLYVNNLPWSANWADLKDLFGTVATVERAEVATDRDGRSKGFGAVIMQTTEDAEEAVRRYQDYELNGRRIGVRVDEGPRNRTRDE